jgi:hypothetical protein
MKKKGYNKQRIKFAFIFDDRFKYDKNGKKLGFADEAEKHSINELKHFAENAKQRLENDVYFIDNISDDMQIYDLRHIDFGATHQYRAQVIIRPYSKKAAEVYHHINKYYQRCSYILIN